MIDTVEGLLEVSIDYIDLAIILKGVEYKVLQRQVTCEGDFLGLKPCWLSSKILLISL